MAANKTGQPPPRRAIVGSLEGMAQAGNVDRRKCKRTVEMKVLCFGQSRTGTSSLRQALLDLGYHDVYHYASVLNENPRDVEMWLDAIKAKAYGIGKPFGREEWDQLLGHCEAGFFAATDTPVNWFYHELLEAYPDAKVIVTVRDSPQQWFDSHMKTIIPFIHEVAVPPPSLVRSFCGWFLPPAGAMAEYSKEVASNHPIMKTLIEDAQNGTRKAEKLYVEHTDILKALIPSERLLVLNVKDGWTPLCDFLGHDIPVWDFPRANSSEDFHKNTQEVMAFMQKLMLWNMGKVFVPVLVAGVASAAWWRYASK